MSVVFKGSLCACAGRNSRTMGLLAHAGLAVRTPSSITKTQSKGASRGLPDPPMKGSGVVFGDNLQLNGRTTSDFAQKLSITVRIAPFTMCLQPTSPSYRAQFDCPLRQHPLRPLSLDDFRTSEHEQQLIHEFIEGHMLKALAEVLIRPDDVIERQHAALTALHVDGLRASVCANAQCTQRFRKLHGWLKRVCPVFSSVARFSLYGCPLTAHLFNCRHVVNQFRVLRILV
jgi:hypothetical protein